MIEDGLQVAMDLAREQVPFGVIGAWALAGVVAAAVLFATSRRRYLDAKVGGSLLVLGAVGGALLWSSLQPGAEYYKYVDEVVENARMMRDRRMHLQVHGRVVDGSIEQRRGTDDYRFRIESREPRPRAVLEARYSGAIPDTFRSGTEIIAKGMLDADGRLQVVPDGIMANCPTRYDSSVERVAPVRQRVW